MKREGIAHVELSALVARLGHTDRFVVADAGLPVPRAVPFVDLALGGGKLDFRSVLDALLDEVVVQAHLVADEVTTSPAAAWLAERAHRMGERSSVSHERFKELLPGVAFVVRTGERTPYANVLLECGVPF